jgi:hypothetical protein
MTKQEFIREMGGKLSEELSRDDVLCRLQYYSGYIDAELRRGRTEEEVTRELGDPVILARNILLSPQGDPFNPWTAPDCNAYEEGGYQAENRKNSDELAKESEVFRMEQARIQEEIRERDQQREETREQDPRQKEMREPSHQQEETIAQDPRQKEMREHARRQEEMKEHPHGRQEKADKEEEADRPARSERPLMMDDRGDFRWDFFAVILAAILGMTAGIWILIRILTHIPVYFVLILVAALIAYVVYQSGKK